MRLWGLPLWWIVVRAGLRETVRRDAERFATCSRNEQLNQLGETARFGMIAARFPEFRSLVHARLKCRVPLPVRLLLKAVWRPMPTLFIYCDDIGPGLFIQHGFATTLTARSIGEDCWINQQVTIGWTADGMPALGDRVRVGAGAVVLGPISLGDDAKVGANATVLEDVPDGVAMVGPKATPLPARRPVTTSATAARPSPCP